MKKILTLLTLVLLFSNSWAAMKAGPVGGIEARLETKQLFSSEMNKMDKEELLDLTPEKYKKNTGKKMGLLKRLLLKKAQKRLHKKAGKTSEDIPQWLYIVLAIFWLGWLAMALLDDWNGSDWIISLLLYFLFWLPGFIFTMIKMSNYY